MEFLTQEHKQTRYQMSRREFLRNTAVMGQGFAGATFVTQVTSPLTMASNKPDFVGARGTDFTLNGGVFFFAGTNNYYLHYKSHFMIDDVLKNAVAMGLRVMRCWGFLDGNSADGFVMQPSPGVYPEDGYERFDYTVWRAGQLGLKLVVPLVNNWNDFGGMNQYVTWFGGGSHDTFYTNPAIKQAYKNYNQHFLNRRNRYNGRKMKQEAAIMTWELANEPRCDSDHSGDTLVNWAGEISDFIKSMDGLHLVAVGDEGFYNYPGNPDWTRAGVSGVDWKRLIALPTIDYGTLHLYPDYWHSELDETSRFNWGVQWITDHMRRE